MVEEAFPMAQRSIAAQHWLLHEASSASFTCQQSLQRILETTRKLHIQTDHTKCLMT